MRNVNFKLLLVNLFFLTLTPLLVLPPRTSTLMQQHTTISSAECLARWPQEESILDFPILKGIRISNMGIILLLQAMYENLLVELPLAPFFLSKILGNVNFERLPTNIFATGQTLDIDHLDSLDPELYRNLLSLKTFEGDVQVCTGTPNTYSKIGFNYFRTILASISLLWWRSLVRPG